MSDLEKLKAEQMAARDEYERWNAANYHGQTAATLVEIDLEYLRAQRRYAAACDAYNKALMETINGR